LSNRLPPPADDELWEWFYAARLVIVIAMLVAGLVGLIWAIGLVGWLVLGGLAAYFTVMALLGRRDRRRVADTEVRDH